MKSTRNCAKSAKAGALFLSGIAALAIQIPPASAADYGLGVTHGGDNITVLIPIRLDSLTVEPEVTYTGSKTKTDPATSGTSRDYVLATGIYARRALGPSFESYVGGRVGIQKIRERSQQGANMTNQKSDAWFAAPTMGLQYSFSKQFSISLDAGLVYMHTNTKDFNGATDGTSTFRNWETLTRVLLRGYF